MATTETIGIPIWRYFMVTAMMMSTAKGATDNGPCTEEPCECESLTPGFELAAGWATAPPTIPKAVAWNATESRLKPPDTLIYRVPGGHSTTTALLDDSAVTVQPSPQRQVQNVQPVIASEYQCGVENGLPERQGFLPHLQTMNRIFSITGGINIPDGTVVYSFLNPKDITSDLPWDLMEGFSIAAGDVEPNNTSKIHVMPLVTQVAFALGGTIEIWMKGPEDPAPYTLELNPQQAVLTRPGTLFQLVNKSASLCRLLYIVSPAYMYELDDDGTVLYDDAIVLDEDWAQLEAQNWHSPKLRDIHVMQESRDAAAVRLARLKRSRYE